MHTSPTGSSTDYTRVSPDISCNSHGCPLPIHRGLPVGFGGSRKRLREAGCGGEALSRSWEPGGSVTWFLAP